jgi:hypothetical protein
MLRRSSLMSLIRLVYASESRLVAAERHDQLGRIVASARHHNDQNHVTGYLLATSAAFAQVLEGAQANIAETYGRIVVDPRHSGVRLLSEETIAERAFSRWSMGLAEHDETTTFIFGLYGVSPETDLNVQRPDTLFDLATELSERPGGASSANI